ncbi:MAG: Ig-like domain-containing protein [Ignavibacteriaceae bacterium]|nr:Ig-like domain-containing protein [Ignavibacteriaceae bacterium]
MAEFKRLSLLFFALISFHCANQLPPGGGEVDRIPPQIDEYYPVNQTTNFNEKYFELSFSEYVEKRSFRDAVFISPSLKYGFETDWSGKSVRVNFNDTLRENTTYTVTIGTDVVDYNNKNRMAESFVFAFATGDKIANGTLSGTVFSENPSGVLLFAYLNPPEDLNISEVKPDYISQAGKEGTFTFTGLNNGMYRVFAVKDEFKDLLFQPEQDLVGIPSRDFTISPKDTGHTGLNFVLSKIDTISPRLISAVMTDVNHLLINFSEDVRIEDNPEMGFEIVDSIGLSITKPELIFKGRGKEKELFIGLKDVKISEAGNYFLRALNFKDAAANLTHIDSVAIIANEKPDTSAASIFRVVPPFNSNDVNYADPRISFYFDDVITFSDLFGSISVSDTGGVPVAFINEVIDASAFTMKFPGGLKPQTDYIIRFDLGEAADPAGNALDSIYVYRFRTKSDLSYTGLYGQLQNYQNFKSPVVLLEHLEKNGLRYYAKPNPRGNFEFTKIEPGKYRVRCFNDIDGDSEYSEGKLFPFQYSEDFFYFKDEINLAPRWAVTDFVFDLGSSVK